MPSVVELQNVSKYFGPIKALDSITVDFKEGETVAFLGPNGAGKSTLLKIIAAQLAPTRGETRVMGFNTTQQPEQVKRNIGLVGHRSFMYDELTVEENLSFYGYFFDADHNDIDHALDITNLQIWRGVKTGHLSFGLRKRADIARAVLGSPRVLVLDELFSGLDTNTSKLLVKHLSSQDDKTILISSHSIAWARTLCKRGIYLDSGLIVKDVNF